jgi:hypothetical protein
MVDDVIESAAGAYVRTETGTQVDLCNADGRVLLGHAHPDVVAAVRGLVERGAVPHAGFALAEQVCAALREDLGSPEWEVRVFADEEHALDGLIRAALDRGRWVLAVGPRAVPRRAGVVAVATAAEGLQRLAQGLDSPALVVIAAHPFADAGDRSALLAACTDRTLPVLARDGAWSYRRHPGPRIQSEGVTAHLFGSNLANGHAFAALCYRRGQPFPVGVSGSGHDAIALAAALVTRDAICTRCDHDELAARCGEIARYLDGAFARYALPFAAVDAFGALAIIGEPRERLRLRQFAARSGIRLAAGELQWPSFAVTASVVVDACARLNAACKRLREHLDDPPADPAPRPRPTLSA